MAYTLSSRLHSSSGLALQVIENKDQLAIIGESKAELERVCKNWNDWFVNPLNPWDFHSPAHFQDDSGV